MLAVSDESPEEVESYVESTGLQLKVGAGFTGGAAWGVSSYPSSALVSRTGKVLWLGHPRHLSKEMLESALADVGD